MDLKNVAFRAQFNCFSKKVLKLAFICCKKLLQKLDGRKVKSRERQPKVLKVPIVRSDPQVEQKKRKKKEHLIYCIKLYEFMH